MTGVVIFAHGGLGESLIKAVELIAGPQEQVKSVGLHHGDGVVQFEDSCRRAICEADTGEGVLIFVDFLGGTPSNIALKLLREEGKNRPCIAGTNMPMLVDVLTSRDSLSLGEQAERAIDIGRKGVRRLDTMQVNLEEEIDEDF